VILAIVLLVVVVAAVSVGVVLSKNDHDQAVLVENKTIAANETSVPSFSSVNSTERPTAAPFPESIVNQFLSGLPAYSIDLAESDADSPQAKALVWLDSDPQYNDYELYRLNQRHALAVLYYSTNGGSWINKTGWLSGDNECTWYMDDDDNVGTCGENSRLTLLELWNINVGGSIPTEVELLTNLERMLFRGEALSGTIHSEL
jgi:hypothetical protein